MRHVAVLVFGIAIVGAGAAQALIIDDLDRRVSVEFIDDSGNEIAFQLDFEFLPPGGVFQQPLSVFIGGSGFQADINMDASGFFGIVGQQFIPGQLITTVSITVSVENDGPSPVNVPFGFIINEGHFSMTAGQGSTLDYDLRVGILVNSGFGTSGQLLEVPPTMFTSSGDDIGAMFDGFNNVDVPFSFNSGAQLLAPGDSRVYAYDLIISSNVQQFAEGVFFSLQDPLLRPDLPPGATQFKVVPEPASMTLLGIGAGILGCGSLIRRGANSL